jgi:hypothetical protein
MILNFILNKLGIGMSIPEGSEALTKYTFGVLLLSLIALLSFINVLGYFLSFYLLQRYNITDKYPKLKKIVGYYEKSSLLFVFIEVLFCIVCLLILIITAFIYLKNTGFN